MTDIDHNVSLDSRNSNLRNRLDLRNSFELSLGKKETLKFRSRLVLQNIILSTEVVSYNIYRGSIRLLHRFSTKISKR